jgi:hypothetical protein
MRALSRGPLRDASIRRAVLPCYAPHGIGYHPAFETPRQLCVCSQARCHGTARRRCLVGPTSTERRRSALPLQFPFPYHRAWCSVLPDEAVPLHIGDGLTCWFQLRLALRLQASQLPLDASPARASRSSNYHAAPARSDPPVENDRASRHFCDDGIAATDSTPPNAYLCTQQAAELEVDPSRGSPI